jgi:hypothetical protein
LIPADVEFPHVFRDAVEVVAFVDVDFAVGVFGITFGVGA